VHVGCVSAAGHVYACNHGSGYSCFHTALVIDRSGSMCSTDVRPANPEVRHAIAYNRYCLDNIAGVVCEAALAYMRTWQARSSTDRLSCITLNTQPTLVCEAQQLDTPGTCTRLLSGIMQEVSCRLTRGMRCIA
jgi:hypothetical protein